MSNNRKTKMDPRCPRKLSCTPDSWCPLAVLRLKAIRNAGRELSEEEESKLPGCPWGIDHQLANYCFFKYLDEYISEKPPSDMEIASFLCLSIDTVKNIEKQSLEKLRSSKEFKPLSLNKSELSNDEGSNADN